MSEKFCFFLKYIFLRPKIQKSLEKSVQRSQNRSNRSNKSTKSNCRLRLADLTSQHLPSAFGSFQMTNDSIDNPERPHDNITTTYCSACQRRLRGRDRVIGRSPCRRRHIQKTGVGRTLRESAGRRPHLAAKQAEALDKEKKQEPWWGLDWWFCHVRPRSCCALRFGRQSW